MGGGPFVGRVSKVATHTPAPRLPCVAIPMKATKPTRLVPTKTPPEQTKDISKTETTPKPFMQYKVLQKVPVTTHTKVKASTSRDLVADPNSTVKESRTPHATAPYSLTKRLHEVNANISIAQVLSTSNDARRQLSHYLFNSEPSSSIAVTMKTTTPHVIAPKEYQPKKDNMSWYLPVTIQKQTLAALVDTGSIVSLISTRRVTDLGLTPQEIRPIRLCLANNSHCTVNSALFGVVLTFDQLHMPIDLLVIPDVSYDLLLGKDFLSNADLLLARKEPCATISWLGQQQTVKLSTQPDLIRYGAISVDNMADEEACPILSEGDTANLSPLNPVSFYSPCPKTSLPTISPYEAALRKELPSLFDDNLGPLSKQCPVEHHIASSGEPIKQRSYRVPPQTEDIIYKEVKAMLEKGIICQSVSPWASPLVLVKKKDGTTRVCVDFRKLNTQTEADAYPLPRVEELLEDMAGHEVYSSLDLYSGYHQIPMATKDIQKTCFTCKYGNFEYLVMPFGLKNAPATFQRMMDQALEPAIRQKIAVVYLDDISIMSNSMEQHQKDLLYVGRILADWNMKIKATKCKFGVTKLHFLGHIVSKEGIATDPAKCIAIRNWGTPKNVSQLRSFLGIAGYYRRFVPGFATPLAVLSRLLKKDVAFQWGEPEERALQTLKDAFCQPPILVAPHFDQPFHIVSDASDYAIGAALLQMRDNTEHPVRYWSRTLTPAERNYSTTEKEALAVISALKIFRVYILGRHVRLYTDHQALKQVFSDPQPNGRRARWIATFQEYDVEIRHRPGAKNLLADSLSRDAALAAISIDDDIDPDLKRIYHYLTHDGELVSETAAQTRFVIRHAQHMEVRDGELYRRSLIGPGRRVIMSHTGRQALLAEVHDDAHFGQKTTFEILSGICWWPSMHKDVIDYVRSCTACQAHGPSPTPSPPIQLPIDHLFGRINIDYIGPLPLTEKGNQYIIVATEALTRWPIARAVRKANAETTARFIYEDIIVQYGLPDTILTDQGTHFVNELIDSLTAMLEIKHFRSTPYHPRTNGAVERLNSTLCRALARLREMTGADWDDALPSVLLAYRIRPHSVTGLSPFRLLYGVSPRLPNGMTLGYDPLDPDHLAQRRDLDRIQATRPPATKPSRFHIDQALLWKPGRTPAKFEAKLGGPFFVESIGPNDTYILRTEQGSILPNLISGDCLVPYFTRPVDSGRRVVMPQVFHPQEGILPPEDPPLSAFPPRIWGH
jgi:transposase InsO family protein